MCFFFGGLYHQEQFFNVSASKANNALLFMSCIAVVLPSITIALASEPGAAKEHKVGRRAQKADPGLVRPDWDAAKLEVMERALEAKFRRHAKPRQILLSTCAANAYCEIIEASPHDYFWGVGLDRTGKNWLGVLLMAVRDRLAQDASSR